MKQVFSSFAMRRSGHHAVMYWVFAHFKNSTIIRRPWMYKTQELSSIVTKKINKHNNIFLNFEDKPCVAPAIILDLDYNEVALLTLRDPFNLCASRLSNTYCRSWYDRLGMGKIISLWKDHAKEFLNATISRIAISYNEWFVSTTYKDHITSILGGDKKPSKSVQEYVPWPGGGSSFDHHKYAGCASKMRTLERWKSFSKNNEYASMFDEETINLSRIIFGKGFVNKIVDSLIH